MASANQPETQTTAQAAPTAAAVADAQDHVVNRFAYEQLRAPYQGYADEVASLMRAYGDILAITDPSERAIAMDMAQNWARGVAPTPEQIQGLTAPLAGMWNALGRPGGSAVDTAQGAADLANGAADIGAATVNGLRLPGDIVGGIFDFFKDTTNEALVRQLNDSQSDEIGRAYASVLQAQADGRGDRNFFQGLFSGDFMQYAGATLATGWDFVRGTVVGQVLARLPVVGPFLNDLVNKNASAPLGFNEHLQRAFATRDVVEVRNEMLEVPEIGGVPTELLAPLLTQGGISQNAAGQNTDVTAPDRNSVVPTAANAERDANGNYVVAPANGFSAANDAVGNATDRFVARMRERIGTIDTPVEALAVGAGVAAAGSTAHGMAEGASRPFIGASTNAAARAQTAAEEAQKLHDRANAAREGRGFRFWERGAESANRLDARANQLEAAWERHANVAESRAGVTGRLGQFAEAAAEPRQGLLNLPRNVGRGIGGFIGNVAEHTSDLATRAGGRAVGLLRAIPGVGEALVAGGASALPVVGKVAGFGVRRVVPIAAPVISGGMFAASAVNGDSRGIWEHGTELGTIGAGAATGAAMGLFGGPFAPATVPAGALIGAGIGGIASIFTGWGARAIYDRNHPAPASNDGALGAADPQLHRLAADAQERGDVRAVARGQAASFANSNVSLGGTIQRNEDGSLPTPTRLSMQERPSARDLAMNA